MRPPVIYTTDHSHKKFPRFFLKSEKSRPFRKNYACKAPGNYSDSDKSDGCVYALSSTVKPFTSSGLSNTDTKVDEDQNVLAKAQMGEEFKSSFEKITPDGCIQSPFEPRRNLEVTSIEGYTEWISSSHEKAIYKLLLDDLSLKIKRVEEESMVQGPDGPSPPGNPPDDNQENEQEPPVDAQDGLDTDDDALPCTTADSQDDAHAQEQRNREPPS